LSWYSLRRHNSPDFCPLCGARFDPKSGTHEPHSNLILVCLLAFGAVALLVAIFVNYPKADTHSSPHLSQNGPGNFVSDPEMYYEMCGPPTDDNQSTLANGEVQRTLVYSREGISLHFILRSGHGWEAKSPYATVYPGGDVMGAETWRQTMGCLFEENDISSDN